MDFVNLMRGGNDTFLFTDSTDYMVIDESLGTGDGVTTEFQLVRRLYAGGFAEDIIAPNVITDVKVGGSATTAYTLDSATGIITFDSPPGSGSAVTSSFSFYFRCRFMTDAYQFENFLSLRWRLPELRFKSVVL
jgi:uncharacterized protein (TIGR02217 family)